MSGSRGAAPLEPGEAVPAEELVGGGGEGHPWRRRVAVGLCTLALLGVLAGSGGYVYLHYRFSQIRTVHIKNLALQPPGKPFNILVIGSDSRTALGPAGSNSKAFGSASVVAGQRSDVTSILHIDPRSHRASVLSIPRDLFIPIPGTNGSNRINEAYQNGPDRLIQTIQDDLGIPIQHFVVVNFDGFQNTVNALGGVRMSFPDPARDAYSGLRITTAGCQVLQGPQALGVARARHYEYRANGYWHYDPTSDLGRIARQHVFLRAVAKAALSKGLTNPFTANAFLGAVVQDFTIDDRLSLNSLVSLARDFRGFDPTSIASYTLPTVAVNNYEGFGDVLFPEQAADAQTVAEFLSERPPGASAASPASVPPSRIEVSVRNGAGTAGLAARVAAALRAAGFQVASVGDADSFGYSESVIHYAPGALAYAQALAARLVGGAQLREDTGLSGSMVALVVGSGYAGVVPAPAPGAPATIVTTTPVAGGSGATGVRGPVGQDEVRSFDPTTC